VKMIAKMEQIQKQKTTTTIARMTFRSTPLGTKMRK
jgi:hypothetical protein